MQQPGTLPERLREAASTEPRLPRPRGGRPHRRPPGAAEVGRELGDAGGPLLAGTIAGLAGLGLGIGLLGLAGTLLLAATATSWRHHATQSNQPDVLRRRATSGLAATTPWLGPAPEASPVSVGDAPAK
jgi:hypothetical protein